MKKIGIIIDDYKESIFRKLLTDGGFAFELRDLGKQNAMEKEKEITGTYGMAKAKTLKIFYVFIETQKINELHNIVIKANFLSKNQNGN